MWIHRQVYSEFAIKNRKLEKKTWFVIQRLSR